MIEYPLESAEWSGAEGLAAFPTTQYDKIVEIIDAINAGGGGGGVHGVPTTLDKEQVPATGTGNAQTTGIAISGAPVGNGYVAILLNSLQQVLGDGVKTKDCYFSNDGGTTARSIAGIEPGDVLYWNGLVAGFDLSTVDRIDFNYNI